MLRRADQPRVHHFSFGIFFPRGLTSSSWKICSNRFICSSVSARCAWNACFNAGAVAFFTIFGNALVICFSAEYKSFNSSTIRSRKLSISTSALPCTGMYVPLEPPRTRTVARKGRYSGTNATRRNRASGIQELMFANDLKILAPTAQTTPFSRTFAHSAHPIRNQHSSTEVSEYKPLTTISFIRAPSPHRTQTPRNPPATATELLPNSPRTTPQQPFQPSPSPPTSPLTPPH